VARQHADGSWTCAHTARGPRRNGPEVDAARVQLADPPARRQPARARVLRGTRERTSTLPVAMADTFSIHLEREEGYRFRVDFETEGVAELVVDEGPPLGQNAGPNPSRLLATAVGDCLSASLVFCLSKSRVEVGALRTKVVGTYTRNEQKRLRIGGLDVTIEAELPDAAAAEKCLALFEDFCVVTASVRKGVPVAVRVRDAATGRELYARAAESGE
jgi:uncharacterized OsmC-like protein